ncbi:uncharacterized protein EV420DRAFT_1486208 [Desarmillaria tabescens]|uniref:Uncharacterized protein n=1 Tax=Armillaria tabescens TaxID=1929756 RepID=A0AA39MMS8_ARMTA|nr:uncharacterized protein EV420DRAFT_1486208 [Desarmillaria tabescens]KAK0439683.1 hypothetical protein EV420DRAFT_1486208 [Desarmillaria tabescens]
MSQIDPDFVPIQVLARQVSDSWFNAVIIESLLHVSSNTPHRAQTKVLTGISIVMYIMAVMHISVRWFYARRAFIVNGETEETRFFALTDSLVAGGLLWVPTISSVVGSINILTADCVIIWRCWIIWQRNWRIIVLPSICTLCGTIFDIFFLVQELTPLTDQQGKPVTPWGSDSINWGVAYYSTTLSTTIICTALIVFRLIRANRTGKSLRFAPNPYHKVMEIMVESAALYVVALAVYIPFIATNSPYSNYPQVVLASVTGIAPTLILLRVASRSPVSLSRADTEGSVTSVEKDDVILITPGRRVEAV